MIIKIEDAPNIKNIKIDISFDEDGNVTQTINTMNEPKQNHKLADVDLDLDEDYNVSEEIVQKPVIPDIEREVNVSSDMVDAEF